MAGRLQNQRDDAGWRIPENGTTSRKIYDLSKAGMAPKEIASFLGIKVGSVRVLKWKIRNPVTSNRYAKEHAYDKYNDV